MTKEEYKNRLEEAKSQSQMAYDEREVKFKEFINYKNNLESFFSKCIKNYISAMGITQDIEVEAHNQGIASEGYFWIRITRSKGEKKVQFDMDYSLKDGLQLGLRGIGNGKNMEKDLHLDALKIACEIFAYKENIESTFRQYAIKMVDLYEESDKAMERYWDLKNEEIKIRKEHKKEEKNNDD